MARIIRPFDIDPVYSFQLDLAQADPPLELARVIAHLEKIPWYLADQNQPDDEFIWDE